MNNKVIPDPIRSAAELALSYYPELAQTEIHFQFVKKAWVPYAARPYLHSLFSKRKYKVVLVHDVTENSYSKILIQRLPFEAQVGILGHELAHIVDYEEKSLSGLFRTGLLYFFSPFRKGYERQTDIACIRHGLGKFLLEYALCIRKYIRESGKLRWIETFYLSPEEIIKETEKQVSGL